MHETVTEQEKLSMKCDVHGNGSSLEPRDLLGEDGWTQNFIVEGIDIILLFLLNLIKIPIQI
jgi:hypothetical protein